MNTIAARAPSSLNHGPEYAKVIEKSKRIRWDIDKDVIRGRKLDSANKFLPDGLSKVNELEFLSVPEQRFLSQIQGRSYANIFGLVERFIGAKGLELSAQHSLGDQQAMEAMVRFVDEELKHQELFRRIEIMAGECMPAGYTFMPEPNAVAQAVLSKCNWAILALTLDIEIFTQSHYLESIEPSGELSPVWKDVFLYHWIEESQHAILDELELRLEDSRMNDAQRDRAVNDLIDLVAAVDGLVTLQADADTDYFLANLGRTLDDSQSQRVRDLTKRAYRWQYIGSGVSQKRFTDVLTELVSDAQMGRIGAALKPLL